MKKHKVEQHPIFIQVIYSTQRGYKLSFIIAIKMKEEKNTCTASEENVPVPSDSNINYAVSKNPFFVRA